MIDTKQEAHSMEIFNWGHLKKGWGEEWFLVRTIVVSFVSVSKRSSESLTGQEENKFNTSLILFISSGVYVLPGHYPNSWSLHFLDSVLHLWVKTQMVPVD